MQKTKTSISQLSMFLPEEHFLLIFYFILYVLLRKVCNVLSVTDWRFCTKDAFLFVIWLGIEIFNGSNRERRSKIRLLISTLESGVFRMIKPFRLWSKVPLSSSILHTSTYYFSSHEIFLSALSNVFPQDLIGFI